MNGSPKPSLIQIPLWAGLGLSALSGILLTASMPGFDVPYIGWMALAPLLVMLLTYGAGQHALHPFWRLVRLAAQRRPGGADRSFHFQKVTTRLESSQPGP